MTTYGFPSRGAWRWPALAFAALAARMTTEATRISVETSSTSGGSS